MTQSTKSPEVAKSSAVTKSPEVVKSPTVVKSPAAAKSPEVANLGESLLNTWAEGLDRVCTTQKELEDLFLQALENQKELWGKFNNDNSWIEEEQKKLFEDFRESTKLNLQSVFGQSASNLFDQFNSQIDVVSNRLQELTLKPYRESLNLFSQSQDQFKQSVQNSFEQQQKIREEFKNQIKSTQQIYFNFYEENMKIALSLFK
jgi:Polyhydroxyalkanoic acid inclusion protein (PhaP_Bmeg)